MAPRDTSQRNLEHWSEAKRTEMQAFYTIAAEDYRPLAAARDWGADLRLRATDGHLRLLDVGCGSGRFPAALLAAGLPAAVRDITVAVDLLDPAAFSIVETRAALAAPFKVAAEHEVALQNFDVQDRYDVAWAIHSLYALPLAELPDGVARMVAALRSGGFGAVAHVSAESHYLRFYEAYRATYSPNVAPFTEADEVAAALTAAGADIRVQLLHFRTGSADRTVIESFLQRCAFDDSISLAQMESDGPLAEYLGDCRTPDGSYHFEHEVHLMTWRAREKSAPADGHSSR